MERILKKKLFKSRGWKKALPTLFLEDFFSCWRLQYLNLDLTNDYSFKYYLNAKDVEFVLKWLVYCCPKKGLEHFHCTYTLVAERWCEGKAKPLPEFLTMTLRLSCLDLHNMLKCCYQNRNVWGFFLQREKQIQQYRLLIFVPRNRKVKKEVLK